ncbi:hypothetical protein Taro_039046 [Colocasia esculenta]|uniref:Secreted protein n=1 Tax=Colocasia esculenta TaxID=4460 RepID=A0A843WP03_COLES|nr:hypothetical protein [Colocasia esculenta]
MGPQLGQATVLHVFVCSVVALSRSSGEVRGESQAGEQREWLFCSPVLGCQSMVASVCVASRPHGVSGVWGGSACRPSTLSRSQVAVLVVRRPSRVVARLSP